MLVDKDKVNTILLEFQDVLKKHRPNANELQLINSKISQMTARNIERQYRQTRPYRTRPSTKKPSSKSKKKRHKIKIE